MLDLTFKFSDAAIVFATMVGPVLAVQAQKWVEWGQNLKQRRVLIFRTLMATRATMLSPTHVEALNAIPVEFYGVKGKLKEIMDEWKAYLDHLSQPAETSGWEERRIELFYAVLFNISEFLRYKFTLLELKREVYFPTGHAQVQTEQDFTRQAIVKLLRGEIALPMAVKSFPSDPELIKNQTEIQKRLLDWLEGQTSVKVHFDTPNTSS
jgi:hypothetical protein